MRAGELACGEINILEEKNMSEKFPDIPLDEFEIKIDPPEGGAGKKPAMEQYIGTKIVEAVPMSRGEYNKHRFFPITGEDLAKEGYLVRYQPDGYESWSPKDVFETAYRRTDGMSFGLAIEAAKMGKRISRRGWNSKNMSVAYQKGYPDGIPCNENTAKAWGMKVGELFKCRPYLQLRCADGSFQMWTASQSDILADDWYIVG